ncbi:uncharacterized protein LAJ45_03676 [Morchella importuna]|uniref:uncharacterized protein n=1 Tax=Morchella importuna TaxID=1174673 RepID=UPI001E8CB871|nr:uncharacterized protein LAJ45_03676 [Morchella importuna]KAH8152250.1 hypothetical protein LAJ45_03676 [Morchella importuna]
MSFTITASRPIRVGLLNSQISVLKADLFHSQAFLERYVRLHALVQVQSINAVNPPVAGDAISIRNEGMAARIVEIRHTVISKTRSLNALEDRLAMIYMLEANRWAPLHMH